MWWDALLYDKFTAESVLKEFLKSLDIWQSYGEKVSCLKRPMWQGAILLKDEELAWDMTYGGQANLDHVIDKCQTGVMSITCYSPTDAVSDRMLTAGVLSRRLSYWLIDVHTVGHSVGCHCKKYLFISEQNDADVVRRILLSNCFDESCIDVRFTQLSVTAILERKHFTR